jgi:hypothetical protein|uniref:Uncharacterized protein n=1 Tax=viral metagenome TaxID=1070528 RepID=A0A6C0K6R3_9ZZZZ
MEFESPIKEGPTTFIIPINTTKQLDLRYPSKLSKSISLPSCELIDFKKYIADIAIIFEEYSLKWFNKTVFPLTFINEVLHKWNTNNYIAPPELPPEYIDYIFYIYQIWCPVKIIVNLNKITIEWDLIKSSHGELDISGNIAAGHSKDETIKKSEEVPYSKNQILMVLKRTPRSEYHRKIRKARIILAATKLRLDTLMIEYIEKYGNLDNTSDSDSILSFDLEDK